MKIIIFILFCIIIVITLLLIEKTINPDQFFPKDKDINDFIKKHTKRYK